MEKDRTKRRFDGHLGRFDPTKSPQHYDPQQPWLTLLRRERKATKIEYIPLVIAWVSLPPQGGVKDLGRLDTAYLLQLTGRNIELDATISAMTAISTIRQDYVKNCPKQPLESEVKELGGVLHFADAVDKVAAVQRGLRLKSAWIRMVRILSDEQSETATSKWIPKTPFASEDVIGAWINGAKEEDVYWLLKHRIPCFIIHEIPVHELYLHREDPKYPDFVALSDAHFLVPKFNGFEHVSIKWKALITTDGVQEGMPTVLPNLSAEERVGSDPAVQGWSDNKHRLLEELPETVMKPVKKVAPAQVVTQTAPSRSQSASEKAWQPEIRSIAPDRGEWVVPPAIMAATPGKWSYWKETDLGEVLSCFCLVTSKPIDCERVYFDRIKRRMIYFMEDLEIPPGVVSEVSVFGCPAPTGRFVELFEGKGEREHPPSLWLYTEQEAKRGTVGQKASPPSPNELPRKAMACSANDRPTAPPTSPSSTTSASFRSSSIDKAAELPPARPIPTEPRAHRLARETRDLRGSEDDSALGRRLRTPSMSMDASEEVDGRIQPKKLRSSDISIEREEMVSLDVPTEDASPKSVQPNLEGPSPSPAPIAEASPVAPFAARSFVKTLTDHSSDSHYLCFEGLPFEWEACCSWLYSMAVSSHFVWISRIFRTEENSLPLIWLDMGSNDDACKIHGYLTHRTTQDNTLVISHFVSESTFNEAFLSHTHLWERPASVPQLNSDDPMEGPSLPLEFRLTSPRPPPSMPDVSLLHRAGVTLEERVEGDLPPRRQRGGVKHRKHNAKQLAKRQSKQ